MNIDSKGITSDMRPKELEVYWNNKGD